MTNQKGITVQRLMQINERQPRPAFGKNYKAAIQAVKGEAPSVSRASILRAPRFDRDLHLLSSNELYAALIALYNPSLVELLDQRALSPLSDVHPLTGFPGVVNVNLPPVTGTVEIADRLGYLSLHPIVYSTSQANGGKLMRIPFPYIGDLLLILKDCSGIYCVNWTIKNDEKDFLRPGPKRTKSALKDPQRAQKHAIARHEIEAAFYASANIRTVQIAGNQIDEEVICNLKMLHIYETNKVSVPDDVYVDMLSAFKAAMQTGVPPIDLFVRLTKRHRCPFIDCQTVFYRSIWRRELRVDLYKPILPNKALHQESKDFLNAIESWFQR